MRILLCDNNVGYLQCARQMLNKFVTDATQLYGAGIMSYNMHSLTHLADDYEIHGNLENISCFSFESYLGAHIKGSVRAGYKPLNQIVTHVSKVNHTIDQSKHTYPKFLKPKTEIGFTKLYLAGGIKIIPGVLGSRDNAVILRNDSIAIVTKIISPKRICIQCFGKKTPYFRQPFSSDDVGIFKVSNLQPKLSITVELIRNKVMMLPYKKWYVAITLLHSKNAN